MRDSLAPSQSLAYLIGVIAGDGCITRAGHVYKLEIACDAAYPELISTYEALVAEVTGLPVSIYKAMGQNCYRVVATSATLPDLLGLPAGAKSSSGFAVPEWVFQDRDFVRAFLKGLIETDGSVAHVFRHGGNYSHIHFTASNPVIMASFMRATDMLGYPFKVAGVKAILSNTVRVHELVAELGITKHRDYVYR